MGFIEMPVSDQAKAAIAGLDGKEIHGRRIALSAAVEKEPERKPVHFQRPRREYRGYGEDAKGEIDGNKW